jgi:FG-GAP-like repeat
MEFTRPTIIVVLALPLFVASLTSRGFAQSNPVPLVNQPLVPTTVAPGSANFTLTVNGSGFVSGAVVNWNGTGLPTTFVGHSRLTAKVSATNVAKPSTAWITVLNPPPGGGTSNVVFLQISNFVTPDFTDFLAPVATFGNNGLTSFALGPITADFNRDGKLDLLVFSKASDEGEFLYTSSLLIGNGDGTFKTGVRTEAMGSAAVTVADFNGDGKPDVVFDYVCGDDDGCDPPTDSLQMMLGKGDGTFQSAKNIATNTFPTGLLAADFNGDGTLDIAVFGSNGGLYMLLGNGDGTFQSLPFVNFVSSGAYPCGGIGDYNGDGKLDLLACTSLGGISVAAGNGDGTFQDPSSFSSIGFMPNEVAAFDLRNL